MIVLEVLEFNSGILEALKVIDNGPNSLKVICNVFSQNLLKVVSSCLLECKPICVINFDKLRCKMLKSRSLVVFLYNYSSAVPEIVMRDVMSGCACFVCIVIEILYEAILPIYVLRTYFYIYYAYVLLHDRLSTLNRLFSCLFSCYDVITCKK